MGISLDQWCFVDFASKSTKNLENVPDHRWKQQEQQTLNHPNSNAALAKQLKRKTNNSVPSTAQVQYITHKEIYANKPRETVHAFDELFGSALVKNKNPATPCRTCLTAESYSIMVFSPLWACFITSRSERYLNFVGKHRQLVHSMPHISVTVENPCDHTRS